LNKVYDKIDFSKDLYDDFDEFSNKNTINEELGMSNEIEQISETLVSQKNLKQAIYNSLISRDSNDDYYGEENKISMIREILSKCELIFETNISLCITILKPLSESLIKSLTSSRNYEYKKDLCKILKFWMKVIVDERVNEEDCEKLATNFEDWSVHTIDLGDDVSKSMEALIGVSKTSWDNVDLNKILNGDFNVQLKESVVTIIERIKFLKEQNEITVNLFIN
jgi:hypothetical protein